MPHLAVLLGLASLCTQVPLRVDDPVLLQKWERNGFDLARLAFGAPAPVPSNEALFENAAYRSIAESVTEDLSELRSHDRLLSTSMRTPHRLLDSDWLRSPQAFFELVGIVNRLDRAPFHPEHCGELRFIYRLAYRTSGKEPIYSRLPLTLNVVFWGPGREGQCADAARRWQELQQALSQDSSAISPASLGQLELKSIELNLQSVRWPSTVRPDFGGYAEYLLRVFQKKGEVFRLAPLENTPDVARIQAVPGLREKLRTWIADPQNLAKIDEGVAMLPEEFLARRARSVALAGSHRLANAPFHQLFVESDFAQLSFTGRKTLHSPQGLLQRLNDLSCSGCHQGRTVAGFHFLGKDRRETEPVNSIFVAASPHFLLDQPRRERFFQAVLSEQEPAPFRAPSTRAAEEKGDLGAHCGLGDPSFRDWGCSAGLECRALVSDSRVSPTGVCMPQEPQAGSFCQPGQVQHHENPQTDSISPGEELRCGSGRICEDTSVGFPGGMCSGNCQNLRQGEVCGSIAVLQTFNHCLSRGRLPFAQCLRENVRPGALQSCSETELCRDDYLCAKVSETQGACIPPYFLFQLRVDGHPDPD
ncbi:hypothetical protein DB31_2414 [Hyalangium minutum]|uniref:Uncharacterized protein n=1 Tax=Hyalangium minutum TaxID=394096 RepID=A0A085W8I9_9BACT|nr:hypothetical protein DB31_2414 [Hyalangium minutum]